MPPKLFEESDLATALREAFPEAVAGYVFGSAATGALHAGSDVDLAVLCTRPLDPIRRFDGQEAIARSLGVDVDVVDLRAASTVMQMQVITTGRVLFSSDEAERDRFEDLAYGSYARLNEERAAILAQVAREGSVHGR